jgi:short-subunit dehydrogenase
MLLKKTPRRMAFSPGTCALGTCACLGLAAGLAMFRKRRRQDLTNQVVLITGGSRGLGLAVAREFAKRRCRLALCARHGDELDRARAELSRHTEVLAIPCDVSDPDAVRRFLSTVRGHFGRIDIVVNNAGEIMVAPLENVTIQDFERALAVMFWGTVHTSLQILPVMREQGGGRIVNVASIGGKVTTPHLLAYSCAKAAALAFSEGLRAEAANHGIQVTTVVPGLMRTGSHVNAIFKGNHMGESRWFGIAAGLPLLTMPASRAARGIIRAIQRGQSEAILGLPAVLLARMHALFPNVTSRVLTVVDAILPGPASAEEQAGLYLESGHGAAYRFLTTLNRNAGRRLNQPREPAHAGD